MSRPLSPHSDIISPDLAPHPWIRDLITAKTTNPVCYDSPPPPALQDSGDSPCHLWNPEKSLWYQQSHITELLILSGES